MNIFKKVLVLVLCLSMLVVPLFSFSYVVGHMNHKCTGEDCPICTQIEVSIQNINNYKPFYIIMAYVLVVAVIIVFVYPLKDVNCHSGRTLISLKVELLI